MKKTKSLVVVYSKNQKKHLVNFAKKLNEYQDHFDYIFFDDNSFDGSAGLLESSKIKHISLIVNVGKLNTLKAASRYAKLNKYPNLIFIKKIHDYKIKDFIYVLKTFEMNKLDFIHGNRWIEKSDLCLIRKNISATYKIKTKHYLSDPFNTVDMFSKRALSVLRSNNFKDFYDYYFYLLKNKYDYKSVQTSYSLIDNKPEKTIKLLLFSIKFFFKRIFKK